MVEFYYIQETTISTQFLLLQSVAVFCITNNQNTPPNSTLCCVTCFSSHEPLSLLLTIKKKVSTFSMQFV